LRSVRNIRQVTKAMQTVAASRMRRAQSSVLASRPYEERLRSVLNDLGPYAEPEAHPLLVRRPVQRVAFVLVTSDRGLVGAMNTNLLRTAFRAAREGPEVGYIAVGRKGLTAIRRLRLPLIAEFTGLGDRPTSTATNVIARVAQEEYVAGRVDEVHLVFTRFVSTLRQVPTVRRILPLVPEEEDLDELAPLEYIFEPDPATVLGAVLPRLIEVSVYQAILDSIASEQSARMVAMRNATDNASELIDELTLAANKARQGRITKEMLEIATGAEAMTKG
jgi:F-type H+-transporting ATPase subunit gamma